MISFDFRKLYKRIEPLIGQIAGLLRERASLLFTALAIAIFCFAGCVFYYYVYNRSGLGETGPEAKKIEINHGLYQEIISKIEERDKKFEEGIKETYPDPFE